MGQRYSYCGEVSRGAKGVLGFDRRRTQENDGCVWSTTWYGTILRCSVSECEKRSCGSLECNTVST